MRVAAILAGLWPSMATAEFVPTDWVAQTLDTTRAPGVAAGVVRDGRVQIASGGLRARGEDVEVTDDDLWHIGSNTKSMTATLVARLVEVGQIEWNDTVGEVLGDKISVAPIFANVTYADLLWHQSGLRANISRLDALALSGTLEERDMMTDRLHYAQNVLSTEPAGGHGSYHYSNAGYVVVGAMLQQVTGRTWEVLIKTHVFDPLGLNTAGFGPPGRAEVIDQPRGHRGLLVGAVPPGAAADNIPALGPAGTVHLSVADMLTYLRAHALQDPFLNRDSWAKLHTPPQGSTYAMGWVVTPQGWRAHDGSNTMWYATMGFVPGQDRAVFLATNFAGWGRVAQATATGAKAALQD